MDCKPPCQQGAGPVCSPSCLGCKWVVNKHWWESKHPWLKARVCPTQKVLHLHCQLCEDSGLRPRLFRTTSSAQTYHFQLHEASKKHKSAVKTGGATAHTAPPPPLFEKVLEAFDAGRACGDSGLQGVAGRHKLRKMLLCLAEAVRERVRAKLAAARSLTFHSDASKNRLLLLCEMCGDDLVSGQCLLGTADLEDDC